MEIAVVGLSHKTAPVEIREKVAFAQDLLHEVARAVRGLDHLNEAVILSTCNRVEIFAATRQRDKGVESLINIMAEYQSIPVEDLSPHN
jgi:glutamyl-tRNA reductase